MDEGHILLAGDGDFNSPLLEGGVEEVVFHGKAGAQKAHFGIAPAGGFLRGGFHDADEGDGTAGLHLVENQMGGVGGEDRKVRAAAGQTLNRLHGVVRQLVIFLLVAQIHPLEEGDALNGHIREEVPAHFLLDAVDNVVVVRDRGLRADASHKTNLFHDCNSSVYCSSDS